MDFDIGFSISVFIAGIITSFLPCTFPLIIGYIGILINQIKKTFAERFIDLMWFFIGFCITFIFFSSVPGFFGQFSKIALLSYDFKLSFIPVGGIFLIFVGLSLLHKFSISQILNKVNFNINSKVVITLLGSIFSFAWSPCVGPVLGEVLLLTSTAGFVFTGSFYIIIFNLGLFVSMIIILALYSVLVRRIQDISSYISITSIIAATLFIVLGILFLTGNSGYLSTLVPYSFIDSYL